MVSSQREHTKAMEVMVAKVYKTRNMSLSGIL